MTHERAIIIALEECPAFISFSGFHSSLMVYKYFDALGLPEALYPHFRALQDLQIDLTPMLCTRQNFQLHDAFIDGLLCLFLYKIYDRGDQGVSVSPDPGYFCIDPAKKETAFSLFSSDCKIVDLKKTGGI